MVKKYIYAVQVAKQHDGKPYALVNSGSLGIGFAVSEALAKKNYNLIITARGNENLDIAKKKLEKNYGIQVHALGLDFLEEDSPQKIADYCTEHDLAVRFMANITGKGGSHDFLSLPLEDLRNMATLNIHSVMSVTLLMIPILEKNAPAFIMNTSSLAGFAPIPKKNIYSATKSAVLFFSHSLRQQLKSRKIHVSCLCPGPVYTKESIKEATRENFGWLADHIAVSPEQVGEIAVAKTLKKKNIIVPGTWASIIGAVLRCLPNQLAAWLYGLKKDD